jgi:hypothetical protein
MRANITDQVNRDAKYYDQQQLWRDEFATALAYLNGGIGWQRHNEAIRIAVRNAVGAQVLEIGSRSREWCLFRYGYRRHSSPVINISRTELEVGRTKAKKLGVSCDFSKMDAHSLELALAVSTSCSGRHFCITSISRALREIPRVLQKIVFVKQLPRNPVARPVRSLTPNARTPDGLPLGPLDQRLIGRNCAVDN